MLQNISTENAIQMENKYACHNYAPVPVVCARAKGVYIYDPEGNEYYDCLSAYSAVNQGHCHPKIIEALTEQASKITLCSRAFYSQNLSQWAKYVTEMFGYEAVLPMNTGAEGVESAIKIARRWGYQKKGIPEYEAQIIVCSDNFHGRTMTAVSMSTDPESYSHYGPFLPGLIKIKFNDSEELKKVLEKQSSKVAAFLVEPIQGEAGVIIPSDEYLSKCAELCKKYNVLLIADEIQSGLGRAGKLLASQYYGVRPDVVILGKALSGGVIPVSCVLADWKVMEVMTPGTHGSTYGGNPLAVAVSKAALFVLKEEKLVENSFKLGKILGKELLSLKREDGIISTVRGKGLFWAIVLDHSHPKLKGRKAFDICVMLKDNGILVRQTHDNVIRIAPPLVITESQLRDCCRILKKVIDEIEKG